MEGYRSSKVAQLARKGAGLNGRRPAFRPERPVVEIHAGEIEHVVDEAEAALIAADRGLYQRDGRIVCVAEAKVVTSGAEPGIAQRIFERGEHALMEDLESSAHFMRWNEREKELRACSCPLTIVKVLQQRRHRLRLPILTGVVNAPTLRPDGSLLDQPGYDAKTGLLFDPRGITFPAIPDRPSMAQAKAALARLTGLLAQLPFVGEADRAVAVSAILTACSRQAYATAPMHAVTAPTAGTGKSMVIDVATAIATSRKAAVVALGRTSEELEKRLGGALLSGDPVIALDNCEVGVGGDLLCQMLTQDYVRVRPLGVSDMIDLRTTVLVTATGNNLKIVGDMTRRTLMCRLDARVERPETRVFDTPHPVTEALARRGELAAAAVTIMRAYQVASTAAHPAPLGSFEGWSRMVRDPLVWLGMTDPVRTMEEARQSDPKLEALTSVLAQWRRILGTMPVTTRQVIDRAKAGAPDGFSSRIVFSHPDFREALLMVAERGGDINSKVLGRWVSDHCGRVVDGHKLLACTKLDGNARYQLVPLEEAPGRG